MKVSYNTKPFIYDDFTTMCKVFKALEFYDLELHLGHIIEAGLTTAEILQTINQNDLKITLVDGGWCDFADNKIDQITKQMEWARELKVDTIRLFFSALPMYKMTRDEYKNLLRNIVTVASEHSDMNILFETHYGVGLAPDKVQILMEHVEQKGCNNVGLVFDPINFVTDKKDPNKALTILHKYIKHVHLKGFIPGQGLATYGEGLDISNTIIELCRYTKSFGIEYEGKGSPILGLQKSKENLIKFCEKEREIL